MTRFFKLFLFTLIFSLTLVSCSDPDDRNAYLSSLRLAAFWDETTEIKNDLEVDVELAPDFDPRTKEYTAKASCVTTSVDVLAFAAYPGLDLTVNDQTPESTTTPVNVKLPFEETTTISIYMFGDTFIEATYKIDVTRGGVGDPPAIALSGGLVVNHTLGVDFNDPGYFACNDKNTDITNLVDVIGDDFDSNELGTYLITYDVVDPDGDKLNAVQVIRTVNVVENTAPVITLTGSASVTVELNAEYDDAGATAQDAQEGNLTDEIDTGGLENIDTSVLDAVYTVTYDVMDVGGLSAPQVTRTVTIIAAAP